MVTCMHAWRCISRESKEWVTSILIPTPFITCTGLNDTVGLVISFGGGGVLTFMENQGKPIELIFVVLNFVIATQSRGVTLRKR
jgi:hypothetical protein